MEVWYLSVKNYTEAIRGKNYLQSLNINSAVEKISGKGGCSFTIRVKGDPERASRLLSTAGISVIKIFDSNKR